MENYEKTKQELLDLAKKSPEPKSVLRSKSFKALQEKIKDLPKDQRADYGKQLNQLKSELLDFVKDLESQKLSSLVQELDVSAPFATNVANADKPTLFTADQGTKHPLMSELEKIVEIWRSMGFESVEARQLDDDFHMFASLNFPEGHPARDNFDTFRTAEGFIPPAHTSTMENRILTAGKEALEKEDKTIAAVSYGRCFRNEDVDTTHEHTFYQCEGVFVSRDANLSQMLGLLRSFFEQYYGQKLNIKTQPAFFPFVEPGLEFLIEKPLSLGGKPGEFLEMLGCGMLHPNVLSAAGIDPETYHGFAWGGGVDRLVMLKYEIDDIRYFESGKLKFLREFA
jgi:phenylalanyl-tRNA synthetase alpha chain